MDRSCWSIDVIKTYFRRAVFLRVNLAGPPPTKVYQTNAHYILDGTWAAEFVALIGGQYQPPRGQFPTSCVGRASDASRRKPTYQRSAETARFRPCCWLYTLFTHPGRNIGLFIMPHWNVETSHSRLTLLYGIMASFELSWQTSIEAPPYDGYTQWFRPRLEARFQVCGTASNCMHPQPTKLNSYCQFKGGTATTKNVAQLLSTSYNEGWS
jgi:hypothetical protein